MKKSGIFLILLIGSFAGEAFAETVAGQNNPTQAKRTKTVK